MEKRMNECMKCRSIVVFEKVGTRMKARGDIGYWEDELQCPICGKRYFSVTKQMRLRREDEG